MQFLREAYQEGGRGPYGLAQERGLSSGMVYRWIKSASKLGAMPEKQQRPEDLNPRDKLRLVIEAARLDDAQLGDFLRREGVHEEDLSRWREEAVSGLSGATKASAPPSKRMRDLERELKRKDKALAEAVALLVLSKKARALWGEEDDDMSKE